MFPIEEEKFNKLPQELPVLSYILIDFISKELYTNCLSLILRENVIRC